MNLGVQTSVRYILVHVLLVLVIVVMMVLTIHVSYPVN